MSARDALVEILTDGFTREFLFYEISGMFYSMKKNHPDWADRACAMLRRELDVSIQPSEIGSIRSIVELADLVLSRLTPNERGETLASIFAGAKTVIVDRLKIEPSEVRWGSFLVELTD